MRLSKRQRFEILRRDRYTCAYCGRCAPSVTLEVDHRVPRCKGGSNHPDNLVAACMDCNSGKGALSVEDPEDLAQIKEVALRLYEEWWGAGEEGSQPDVLPRWMTCSGERTPLKFNFDIHEAAAGLCPASMTYADTLDSVLRRAEAF